MLLKEFKILTVLTLENKIESILIKYNNNETYEKINIEELEVILDKFIKDDLVKYKDGKYLITSKGNYKVYTELKILNILSIDHLLYEDLK